MHSPDAYAEKDFALAWAKSRRAVRDRDRRFLVRDGLRVHEEPKGFGLATENGRTPATVLALLAVMLGSALPGSAHTTAVTGTVLGPAPSTTPYLNPEWAAFVAQSCGDIPNGATMAVLNVVAWRNHKATIQITGSAAGSATQRKLWVQLATAPCTEPNRVMGSWTAKGFVTSAGMTFTLPADAYALALVGTAAVDEIALGVAYKVTCTH